MNIISNTKPKSITFHQMELHKVYKSKYSNRFYSLVKVSYNKGESYYNCLLDLEAMKAVRMCDLTAKVDEFIEVDYRFEIKD